MFFKWLDERVILKKNIVTMLCMDCFAQFPLSIGLKFSTHSNKLKQLNEVFRNNVEKENHRQTTKGCYHVYVP